MASPLKPTAVSPATTYCSELEYLIALQSDEICSEVRRSQRLLERKQSYVGLTIHAEGNFTVSGAGSPQLFVDTDGECSQLPPNRANLSKVKRARENNVECNAKRRRRSCSSKSRCRSRRQSVAKQKSSTPTNDLQIEAAPMERQKSVEITSGLNTSDVVTITTSTIPNRPALPDNIARTEPPQNTKLTSSSKSSRLSSKTPRSRISKFKGNSTLPPKAISRPQQPLNRDLKPTSECPLGILGEPKPNYNTLTNSYAYQPFTTQASLPNVYPPHFVHQLPPETNFSQMQQVPRKELNEMCPTPETTPTVMCEKQSYSRSPSSRAETPISRTPSLSDSVAEIFGTKKIRDILKIEVPREYLVHEVHLPVIALILDVELERLRAVLGMAQRLSPDEMQQIVNQPYELINISSSSDEE